MKKLLVCSLVIFLTLAGCSKENKTTDDKSEKYNTYLTVLESNTEFLKSSNYYSITLAVNKLADNSYRYDVIVDNPLVAMYNVDVLCVAKDVTGTLITDSMCPSAGIIEDDNYNLIPNQVDVKKGYPAGVVVSGTIDQPEVNVIVLVVWTGYAKLAENREYLALSATYEA